MINNQTEVKIKVPLDVAQTYWNATEEERQKIAAKITFYLQSHSLSPEKSLDRMLIAQAQVESMILVSADSKFDKYEVSLL